MLRPLSVWLILPWRLRYFAWFGLGHVRQAFIAFLQDLLSCTLTWDASSRTGMGFLGHLQYSILLAICLSFHLWKMVVST